jgi:hypothetical protein
MRNPVVDDQSKAPKVVAVMAQAKAADPHHGRTFILDVGAIGHPGRGSGCHDVGYPAILNSNENK